MDQSDDTLDGIAIIGVHGRFPGAGSVEEFWANLLAGKDTVARFSDDELRASGLDPEKLRREGHYVPARGVLADADRFDAAFFGVHPKEAEVMDPQQRVFLEVCWEALERSGYAPGRINGAVGVYAGATYNTYYLHALHPRPDLRELVGDEQVMLGNEKDYLATRVAYKLDLTGPAIALNTACSSSLVCVVQAYQALATYQCDMALAGGVAVMVPQQRGYYHQEGYIGSPDGHTRTFDVDAKGTVFSNGATCVVLKRLADAVADGDNVIAVIKGVAVNNDGARRASFGAPGVDGQSEAITFAQEAAGFDPESISYVEAHGTATPLGDPIEVAALTKAFRRSTDKRGFCAIGSVKSNVGHMDAAAGTAGLIKTALALKNRQLPASLHFRQPNPKLELESSPFFVNAALRDWTSPDGAPLRAGVSSFGTGGTNAHVVLQEAPALPESSASRASQLLLLSAKTATALEAATEALAARLASEPALPLADVAYTLQVGRSEFAYRRAVVCSTTADAVEALRNRESRASVSGRQEYREPPVVFMFAGQGAQFVGMGAELYRSEPVFRAAVDDCAQLLQGYTGFDLRPIIFDDGADPVAAATRLRQTRNTQPALFTIEYALARLWMSFGIQPAAMIGHSVGEYVAGCLAGVFSLQDALLLVAERARLVQEMPQGSMLAVRLPEAEVLPLLGGGCAIAAVNSQRLCVVSGPSDRIAELEATLAARSVSTRALHTSHAFHSPMMDPVIEPFTRLVRGVTLSPPRIPYISNVSGRWISDEEATSPEYWAEHVRQAVRFADGVEELLADPTRVLLEVGPGQTLTQMARQNPQARGSQRIFSTLGAMGEAELPAMLGALGRLWLHGVTPDWKAFYESEQRHRVVLPTYPFERERFWPAAPRAAVAPGESLQPLAGLEHATLQQSPSASPVVVAAQPAAPLPAPVPEVVPVTSRIESLAAIVRAQMQDLSGSELGSTEPHANFLELGLDSLLLTQAATLLQRKFGVPISFRQLMEEQNTVESLVQYLDAKLPADAFAPAAAAPPAASSAPTGAVTAAGPAPAAAPLAAPVFAAQPVAFLAAPAGAATGGVLDTLLQLHLQMTAQLITLVRAGQGGQAAPVAPAAASTPAVPAVPVAAPVAAPVVAMAPAAAAAPAAHGPFRPLDRTVAGGITPAQQKMIDSLTERYTRRTAGSKQLTRDNRKVLADPRTAAGFKQAWKELIYPLYTVKSQGSRVWDVDGNEYIDFVMGMGANLFGHRPDFVIEAAHRQLDTGFEIGPIQPLAGEVARLVRDVTGMERACFCNTGSEAVLAAMRISRTVTGRDKIVIFTGAYHGIFDEVLVRPAKVGGEASSAPIAPGIPRANTSEIIVLDWGNMESLEVIRRRGDEIAAVLVEPVQSRRLDLQPKAFLQELRRVTQQTGSALVFDEVVNGFRVRPGGAQEYYGIRADIATYGKVIGGGFSLGVVAGSARFLDALDGGQWDYGDASFPEVGVTFFAGTFVRHPVCLAIAKAVLEHIKREGPALQERVAVLASDAAQRIRALVDQHRVPIDIMQFSSLMGVIVKPEFKSAGLLYALLRDQGIHIWENRTFVFTTAHEAADVDRLVAAFEAAFRELGSAGFIAGERPAQVSLPLTEPQKEMLAAVQMDDEASCSYNQVYSLTFDGPLQAPALHQALREIVRRHEALRATIDFDAEAQLIHAQLPVELPQSDISGLATDERAAALTALLDAETRTAFDLARGPLWRARLVRETAQRHRFVFTAHHIICDGWSSAVLFGDLGRAYSANVTGDTVAQPVAANYSEFVAAQAQPAMEALRRTDEDYWAAQYADSVPVLDLPLDHNRPGVKTYHGAREELRIEAGIAQAIRKAGARAGGTMFVTLLAGFEALINRLTGQHDFVLGIPMAGQTLLDNGHLVSHSVHTVPLRCRPEHSASFVEHLKRVRSEVAEAQSHQRLTFGNLVQRLRLERDPSRTPLVSVTFNIDRIGSPFEFAGLVLDNLATPKRFVNFELAINAVDNGTDLLIECDYNTDLFDAATIRRWLGHYRMLLEAAARDPAVRLDDLPLLTQAERDQLIVEWNRTEQRFAGDMRLHKLFEQQAARTPRAEALVTTAERVSYDELNRRSNRLAHQLRARGAGRDKLVGVCLRRSSDLIVALFAVLKSGAAYVPLDPAYPADRIAFMLRDSQAAVLVTTSDIAVTLPAVPQQNQLCLDLDADAHAYADSNPLAGAEAGDLAYVIYTSGSTGVPKGVAIEHRSAATLVHWAQGVFPASELRGVLASTSVCFDLSIFEIFFPLACGGRIILAENALHLPELPARDEVTLLNTVPSAAAELVRTQGLPRSLTTVCLAGEPLQTRLVDALLASGNVRQVWDLYGPSEDTTYSTFTQRLAGAPASIGRPIANTRAYVLDARMNPVPVGVPGELFLGGDGLARGYLGRPELTAERFLPDPFLGNGQRIYRTGDLVRYRADSQLEYIGRLDHQVKVRGFRIELGEIETALRAAGALVDAAVVVREDVAGDPRIVAYVVSGTAALPADKLRTALRGKLPEYMIPSDIVELALIPRTPNGKLDRKALPAPGPARARDDVEQVEPRTPSEELVARVLREVLGRASISVHDNFFDLGGHSLMAARVMAKLRTETGLDLPLRNLFERPTVAELAGAIDAVRWAATGRVAEAGSGPREEIEI
jgi:amino acid adenylation domain-containing protein